MASKENQEALNELHFMYRSKVHKSLNRLEVIKYDRCFETLQKAINELEEYKKYIPNLEEFYKWCKGEYLQKQGMELKSNALKESEK